MVPPELQYSSFLSLPEHSLMHAATMLCAYSWIHAKQSLQCFKEKMMTLDAPESPHCPPRSFQHHIVLLGSMHSSILAGDHSNLWEEDELLMLLGKMWGATEPGLSCLTALGHILHPWVLSADRKFIPKSYTTILYSMPCACKLSPSSSFYLSVLI